MSDLSKRIKKLVDSTFPSVNAAAKAIGIPQQTLDRIVRGQHRAPRVETLQQIADFYDTTVDWLLNGRGAAPSIATARHARLVHEVRAFVDKHRDELPDLVAAWQEVLKARKV